MVNARVIRVKRPYIDHLPAAVALDVGDTPPAGEHLVKDVFPPLERRHFVVSNVVKDARKSAGFNALPAVAGLAINVQRQTGKSAAQEVDSRPDCRNAKRAFNVDVNASLRQTTAPAHNLKKVLSGDRGVRVFKVAGLRLSEAVKNAHLLSPRAWFATL